MTNEMLAISRSADAPLLAFPNIGFALLERIALQVPKRGPQQPW